MTLETTIRNILSFGPRAVGSAAEKMTADFLADRFRQLNLNVIRQPFSTSMLPLTFVGKFLPIVSMIVLYVVSQTFFAHPRLTILLLWVPLAMMWLCLRFGARLFDRLMKKSNLTTENIIGELPAESPDAPTLIVIAHYDSKSQSQPMAPRMLCVIIPLVVYIVLAILALLLLLHISIPNMLVMTLIVIAFVCHLNYLLNVSSNKSPGAIDNASGIGILMDLAEKLPAQLKNKVRLIFLASAAEELGLVGAAKFAQTWKHQLNLDRTQVVNFDSLGAGGTVLLVTSGRLKNPAIREQIQTCFDRRGLKLRSFSFMIGAGMDHMPLARAGFTALSFTQAVKAGGKIHSAKDNLDALNFSELNRISQTIEDWIIQHYSTNP